MATCQSCPGSDAAILVACATRRRPALPSCARAARRACARARPPAIGTARTAFDTSASGANIALWVDGAAVASAQPQPQDCSVAQPQLADASREEASREIAATEGRRCALGPPLPASLIAALPCCDSAWRRARAGLSCACGGFKDAVGAEAEAKAAARTTGAADTAEAGRDCEEAAEDAAAISGLWRAGAPAGLAEPALPCSAMAWRRLSASSRPERVACAWRSAGCVMVDLDEEKS